MDSFSEPLPIIILGFCFLLALYDRNQVLHRRDSLLLPSLFAMILGLYIILPPIG